MSWACLSRTCMHQWGQTLGDLSAALLQGMLQTWSEALSGSLVIPNLALRTLLFLLSLCASIALPVKSSSFAFGLEQHLQTGTTLSVFDVLNDVRDFLLQL